MLTSSGSGADFTALAEAAEDAKITHYQQMSEAHQGILNLIAVAIYDQFEQHQITLVRRELLFDGSEDDLSKINTETFVRILNEAGIDPARFPQWQKLTELRLVANVAKHAEGRSAAELEKIRPDLFAASSIREGSLPPVRRRVYHPLSGVGLCVTREDLDAYFEAAIGFWRQLSEMVRDA